MKVRLPRAEYDRGVRDGIRKAQTSFTATMAIIFDRYGATPEEIRKFEKEFNAYMNAVIEGRVSFDEIIEAKEEEIG